MTLPALLDFASVAIFALTGALAASRAQLDIVGFLFIAALTAIGGGTLRDLLLDRNPLFWIEQPTYIALTSAAALLVFFTAHLAESRYRWLLWLDSFALAVAAAAGVAVALEMTQPPHIVLIMGIVTATCGGLMRDVVCNEVPLVLKQGELYVTAAFAGALAALLTLQIAPAPAALLTCAITTWALRAGSIAFGWRLPTYKHRPPR